ncbi:hypothetical protein [Sporosarcina koreensis]|uniref:hypothetical protein n=1 Tax=Sporosarcina koreensis TaxID=334735 RepID=UPI00058E742A|nr:hypothetical protein [Sporosarcina koreensis]
MGYLIGMLSAKESLMEYAMLNGDVDFITYAEELDYEIYWELKRIGGYLTSAVEIEGILFELD